MSFMSNINVALREQFCQKIGSERVKEPYQMSLAMGARLYVQLLQSTCTSMCRHTRGLSGKYEDTVNTEAKTSNNIKLFLLLLLGII